MPDLPVFLLGHSQGGLVALTLALDHGDDIDGLVVTSPACGVAMAVPAWKELLAVIMARLMPALSIPSGLDPAFVSRDPEVVRAYASDPLIGSDARAGWYIQFREAQDRLAQEAHKVSSPILMLQAGSDKITDPRASAGIFETLGSQDKTFKSLDGLYHEVLNEPEKDQVLGDVCQWLTGHSP
jgi:lysophospholipase